MKHLAIFGLLALVALTCSPPDVEQKTLVTGTFQEIVDHAKWQTTQDVTYDGSYVKLDYPNGDVASDKGVCTDVIVRAYRAVGIDLQQLIHEDMVYDLKAYNRLYQTEYIDKSIDHRRTQNIQSFLTRQGAKQPVTQVGSDYHPGDIVFWKTYTGHVGIVIDEKVPGTNRHYIVHNNGRGPVKQDYLFRLAIIDHYRWDPKSNQELLTKGKN